jgi:response regulator RpfG family c-di-GMP phosphodiesterase
MIKLLVVDDEPNVLNALRRMCLNRTAKPVLAEMKVTTFTAPLQALNCVRSEPFDLVISDYRMPEMNGATFLTHVKELQPDAARIILSACVDMEGIVSAINNAGIFRFVSKPWSDEDLKTTMLEVIAHRDLLLENRTLADEVRRQRSVISRQREELKRLEAETPGITRVRWNEDGAVLLEE